MPPLMKPSPSDYNTQNRLNKRNLMQRKQERDVERHQKLLETDSNQQMESIKVEGSGISRTTLIKIGNFLSTYLVDILSRIMSLLQVPIALTIVGLLFYILVAQIQTRLAASLSAAIPMFCNSPLSYVLFICPTEMSEELSIPEISKLGSAIQVDFPALTQLQVHAFGDLLDESAYSSRVGFELKKAEAAMGDLAVIVQLSQLKGRVNLAAALNRFGLDAAKAGRSLIVLDSKINSALDRIIAMNDYTLREISRLSELTLRNTGSQPLLDSTGTVAKLFNKAMSFMHAELHSLKSIAESTLTDQTALEEQLKTIHMLVAMEEVAINLEKDELLGNLWGFLGGNRRELQQYNYNLALLQAISIHRKQAQSYVIKTLQTLEETSVDLEILRGRIAQPSMEENSTLPLEVHIQSLKAGIQRLRSNKIRDQTSEPPPSRSNLIEGHQVSHTSEITSLSLRV